MGGCVSGPHIPRLEASPITPRGHNFIFWCYKSQFMPASSAIDHRTWKTGLPVRSVVLKPCAGRLVVGWVTTSEYLLLIVFLVPFLFPFALFFPRFFFHVLGYFSGGLGLC